MKVNVDGSRKIRIAYVRCLTHVGDTGEVNDPESEQEEEDGRLDQLLPADGGGSDLDASVGGSHLVDMVDDLRRTMRWA